MQKHHPQLAVLLKQVVDGGQGPLVFSGSRTAMPLLQEKQLRPEPHDLLAWALVRPWQRLRHCLPPRSRRGGWFRPAGRGRLRPE